jgi:hypothetical protein
MKRFAIAHRLGLAMSFILSSLGTTLLTLVASPVQAQDQTQPGGQGAAAAVAGSTDPIVVVTIAPMNKLTADINYIAGALGQPQFGGLFGMMAGGLTQGLDTARPVAVLVPLVDGNPEPIGVIPTNNVESMLKRLEGQTGPADKLEDGTLVLALGNTLVYVRQVGTWAVVARNRDVINLVPADPTILMQGMGEKYDVAVRLNLGEIPPQLREMLAQQLDEQLKQGVEQAMQNQEDADENAIKLSMQQLDQIKKIMLETDDLMFGLNINPSKRLMNIDTETTAIQGTGLADQYSGQQPIPSAYSLVLNANSAIRYHAAGTIAPQTAEIFEATMKSAIDGISQQLDNQEELAADVKAEIEEMVQGLVEIATQTMKEGKSDLGMVVVADDGVFRLAGGGFVHSGEKLAEWVQKLATKLQQIPDPPEFKFNESTYQGVAMHSISIDIPSDKEEAIDLLGPQAVIHLGTGPQAAYFGVGKDSPEMIKRLIDSAGADKGNLVDRPLGQMQIKTLPLLRLAQSIQANDVMAAMIDSVALASEHDFINVTTNSIENGQSNLIEIGEGVLRLIGVGIREAQNAQMRELQQGGAGGQF